MFEQWRFLLTAKHSAMESCGKLLKETCFGGEYRDQPAWNETESGTAWSKVERRYVGKRPCRYQHNLKSLFVRCPLFRCGASPCKTKNLAKLLETEGGAHTQTHTYVNQSGEHKAKGVKLDS